MCADEYRNIYRMKCARSKISTVEGEIFKRQMLMRQEKKSIRQNKVFMGQNIMRKMSTA
jgi:hypothetical protein